MKNNDNILPDIGTMLTIDGEECIVLKAGISASGIYQAFVTSDKNRGGRRKAVYRKRWKKWVWQWTPGLYGEKREAKRNEIAMQRRMLAEKRATTVENALLKVNDRGLQAAVGSLIYWSLADELRFSDHRLDGVWREWNMHPASWLDFPVETVRAVIKRCGYTQSEAERMTKHNNKQRIGVN